MAAGGSLSLSVAESPHPSDPMVDNAAIHLVAGGVERFVIVPICPALGRIDEGTRFTISEPLRWFASQIGSSLAPSD